MNFLMETDPSSIERKVVLPPDAFVRLLFQLKGGTFIDAGDCDLDVLLQDVEFPIGPAGKQAKLESASQGNVLVNRSIVTMTDDIGDRCRILLLHRDQHIVTTGASVLTSGDPRNTPDIVLSNKVTVTPAPLDFERMGFALSSPEQTKGIHYLFDVFRARIAGNAQVTALKDYGTLLSQNEALKAIEDKPLELAIMKRILEIAA